MPGVQICVAFRCGFAVVVFGKTLAAAATATFFAAAKVSCFIVFFARVRRKRLKSSIETQHFASKNMFFTFSLRFYSAFKKQYKT